MRLVLLAFLPALAFAQDDDDEPTFDFSELSVEGLGAAAPAARAMSATALSGSFARRRATAISPRSAAT